MDDLIEGGLFRKTSHAKSSRNGHFRVQCIKCEEHYETRYAEWESQTRRFKEPTMLGNCRKTCDSMHCHLRKCSHFKEQHKRNQNPFTAAAGVKNNNNSTTKKTSNSAREPSNTSTTTTQACPEVIEVDVEAASGATRYDTLRHDTTRPIWPCRVYCHP